MKVSTFTVERTFSCLKRIKTTVRNIQCENRLSTISLSSVEKGLLDELLSRKKFYDAVINKFIQKGGYSESGNSRKVEWSQLKTCAFTNFFKHSSVTILNVNLGLVLQVLAAIRFFAEGGYQRGVGQDLFIALSRPAVSKCIRAVCEGLSNIAGQWIRFPRTVAQRDQIQQKFQDTTRVSGIIGAIDCTHISIVPPKVHEEAYNNLHHGHHSLNICDRDLPVLNLSARYPGRTNDQFIWRHSQSRTEMQKLSTNRIGEFYLIGDSGYAAEPWLQTPILRAEEGTTVYYRTLQLSQLYREMLWCFKSTLALFKEGQGPTLCSSRSVPHSTNMIPLIEEVVNEEPVPIFRNEDVIPAVFPFVSGLGGPIFSQEACHLLPFLFQANGPERSTKPASRKFTMARQEVVLRISHSSLMSSDRMKPRSGDWAKETWEPADVTRRKRIGN
uniref:(California timema) hypothetical protein n=1 Tax=Timema californicum TaxID=61474 RepID=A0A7R9J4I1_TIMCA|nr:unnamed protein product [Timema californicum]